MDAIFGEQRDDDTEQFNDDNDNGSDDDIESVNEAAPDVVKVYFFLLKEVRCAIVTAEKMNVHETQGVVSVQLDNLKQVWNEFRVAHREISVSNNRKYCVDMNVLQSKYFKVLGKMNDLMNGSTSKQVVQLPKIKIPEFDGEQRDWRAFKDLFDKIVHTNASINESIKMQYLKSSLSGKAAKMVEHLPPTAASYKTCYELLNNQYENERENVSCLIDEILDLDVQNGETSVGLKLIHDKTFQCIMSIESIGVSVKNWDVLLIQILMRKLNKNTIVDYESKLNNVKKNQTLSYFLKYLENRFLALMSAETKTKNNVRKNNNEKNNNEKNQKKDIGFQCNYCEKSHSIYKCESFLKLDPAKRFEWAREKKCVLFVCKSTVRTNAEASIVARYVKKNITCYCI